MARTFETTITCDHSDCRKDPQAAHNAHIALTIRETPAEGEPTAPELLNGGDYDFCSWDHAAAFIKGLGKAQAEAAKESSAARSEQDAGD